MSLGRAWEAQLRAWHRAYSKAGLAFIVFCPPPVKILSPITRGRFTAQFYKEGPPDFSGVALGGRGVIFDAKHSSSDRWALTLLPFHQARDLERGHQAGAFSFVALRLPAGNFVLPWSALREPWDDAVKKVAPRGRGSVDATWAAELGAPMDDDGWLSAMEALL